LEPSRIWRHGLRSVFRSQTDVAIAGWHNRAMAKKVALKRSAATGKIVAEFRNGLFLGQSGKAKKRTPLARETAAALAPLLGKALNTPGVRKDAVFGKPAGKRVVYAYFLDPTDTTKLVRESADGRRTVGRMVGGKFRAA
jgi:hypothetical protein